MLKELTNTFGVSGCENEVREIIKNEMSKYCDDIKTDCMGNLICFKKGTKNYDNNVMLTAHMDEIGLIITGINKEGYLRFKTVGGVDSRVLVSKKVIIGKNKISGVIGSKPPHLQDKKNNNASKIKDLLIDIGAKDEEDAKKYVNLGDYVAFDSEYIEFGDGLVKAKALDDRIGCDILINLAKKQYAHNIYYTFTVQEEVGCRGASIAAFNIMPDMAIVVEGTTCADVPGNEGNFSTKLNNGAALSILDRGSYANKDMVKALYNIAKDNKINVQYKQTTMGGNDAGTIHVTGNGIKTAVISVPCRYIHSPSCVASKKDIKSCYDILDKFLAKADDKEWSF